MCKYLYQLKFHYSSRNQAAISIITCFSVQPICLLLLIKATCILSITLTLFLAWVKTTHHLFVTFPHYSCMSSNFHTKASLLYYIYGQFSFVDVKHQSISCKYSIHKSPKPSIVSLDEPLTQFLLSPSFK